MPPGEYNDEDILEEDYFTFTKEGKEVEDILEKVDSSPEDEDCNFDDDMTGGYYDFSFMNRG